MDDEWLMRHFETEHPDDLSMKFRPRPGKINRELAAPKEWRTYHEALHRLWPAKYAHDHNEESDMATDEKIYVITTGDPEDICYASVREPGGLLAGQRLVAGVELSRPDLRPIYGGPTLLEALWSEMDTIMERLMTGQSGTDLCGRKGEHGAPEAAYEGSGLGFDDPCEHEDNGDKYRAQELAWVLAIVTDPYEPSVDKIRAETMARWNAAQAAAADQDDAATRPEGADQ